MSRDITPFGLRMPSDLKARVDAAAESNGRSINAECVARLQESFEARADIAALPVGVLLDEIIQRLGARVQIVVSPEVAQQEGLNLGPPA